MNEDDFLKSSPNKIAEFVKSEGRPKVGVFVPDGCRRLVLAFTEAEPGTEEFYHLSASLPARNLLKNLKMFFKHGLPTLIIPTFSQSVLNRGKRYRQFTALEALRIIFTSQEWRDFYKDYKVRVRVYGRPQCLEGTECAEALAWIDKIETDTAQNRAYTLFYGIGGSPRIGLDAVRAGIEFYRTHHREPEYKEMIELYYGEYVEPADFFIMSSKMSGLGALPCFITNSDTEVYFLPVPGVLALQPETFRQILYDLLYVRRGECKDRDKMTSEERAMWRENYTRYERAVIGLGRRESGMWLPQVRLEL